MSDISIKNIVQPEAEVLRLQYAGQFNSGQRPVTGCPHPISAIQHFVDDTGETKRNGRPINLLICTICQTEGRLVMFDGVTACDG